MTTLHYGAGSRDITPSRPVMLHGYAARDRRSNGVSEPLRLGALAISDGATRMVLITIDIVGVHTSEAELIGDAVEKATGIPAANVLVAASHTHFAPQISTGSFVSPELGFFIPEKADQDRVLEAAVGAARDAVTALGPCKAESVRIHASGVSFNRRTIRSDGSVETNFRYPTDDDYTFSPTDEQITAIRFVSDAGTGAVLVNFGCHPVTGGYDPKSDFYRVSSDYIHYLRRSIEDAWGYPTFFTLGAAGDSVPIDRNGESRRRIGSVIGESVVLSDRVFRPVSGGATPGKTDTGGAPEATLAVKRFTITAETILGFDAGETVTRYERELKQSLSQANAGEAYNDALLARFRSDLYPENRFDIPVTMIRIGSVRLVALPFEVLAEFSTRMKARFPDTVLLSCAGGYQGYLPFEYEYARGGYEASERSTHFVPGTADTIYKRVIEELDRF